MSTANLSRTGILYPLLVSAAISVIVVSMVGVATMIGLIPNAMSKSEPVASLVQTSSKAACEACGVVQSVRAIQIKGHGTGLGAITGGVLGAVVGNELGSSGRGRTALTLVGAGGGAYAGNEIEKNVNRTVRYQIRVKMNDGTQRNFYENFAPAWRAGDRIKIVDGNLARLS